VTVVVAVGRGTAETPGVRRLPGVAHPLVVADGRLPIVEADRPEQGRPAYRLRALA
jgi:hypothetical protein